MHLRLFGAWGGALFVGNIIDALGGVWCIGGYHDLCVCVCVGGGGHQ